MFGRKVLQRHYAPQPPDFPIERAEPAYLKTVWLRIDWDVASTEPDPLEFTRVQAPTKHRFNVNEHYRMGETGVLPSRCVAWNFSSGEIIDMSPIGPFHGCGSYNLFNLEAFVNAARNR